MNAIFYPFLFLVCFLAMLIFLIYILLKKSEKGLDIKFGTLSGESNNTNELTFLKQITKYGSYSNTTELVKCKINDVINSYKKDITPSSGAIVIESVFNNIYYPVFDIDTLEDYALFRNIYSPTPYVLFASSNENNNTHYWGILDVPYNNINDIFYDHTWKICNDPKYIKFCRQYNYITTRGLYENKNRKPQLYHTNGNLSENFQLFIDKLLSYYNKEGLELSILKYQDHDLLIKFNRKRKIEQINKNYDS